MRGFARRSSSGPQDGGVGGGDFQGGAGTGELAFCAERRGGRHHLGGPLLASVQSPLSNIQGPCIAVDRCISRKGVEDGARVREWSVEVDLCGKLCGGEGETDSRRRGEIYQRKDTP